jgi:hypothetical protein
MIRRAANGVGAVQHTPVTQRRILEDSFAENITAEDFPVCACVSCPPPCQVCGTCSHLCRR